MRVVLALAALCFVLGMVQKNSCFQDSWRDGDARYTHMCYSDLPYLYTGRGFAELNWPYSDDPEVRDRYDVMEYPVGISYYAWATAWVTHWLNGSPDLSYRYAQRADALFGGESVGKEVRYYVVVNAIGFAVVTLLSAWFLTRVNPRRPWDAAIFALSPALALTALVNWDLLAVVFVAGALWAWARDRPLATGVHDRARHGHQALPAVPARGAARHLPARPPDPGLPGRHLRGRDHLGAWPTSRRTSPAATSGRSSGTSTPSAAPTSARSGWCWSRRSTRRTCPATINDISWVFFGLWCLGVLVLGLRAPETPRLAQLGFLVVAGFLLVNKVYSPQYVLWLLPLAVLARPRWRDQIVWQAGEILYFASVWWYLGGHLAPAGGGDAGFYWVAIVLRMLAELYLVALVVRDIWQPHRDPVRQVGQARTTRSNAVAV